MADERPWILSLDTFYKCNTKVNSCWKFIRVEMDLMQLDERTATCAIVKRTHKSLSLHSSLLLFIINPYFISSSLQKVSVSAAAASNQSSQQKFFIIRKDIGARRSLSSNNLHFYLIYFFHTTLWISVVSFRCLSHACLHFAMLQSLWEFSVH